MPGPANSSRSRSARCWATSVAAWPIASRCGSGRWPSPKRSIDRVARGVNWRRRFLLWLARQRFVFLGAARYLVDPSTGVVTAEPGSALGLLSGSPTLDPRCRRSRACSPSAAPMPSRRCTGPLG